MNYAIDQGLSTKNRKLNLEDEKEIEQLQSLVQYIKGERKSDLALRGELINMLVDLCKHFMIASVRRGRGHRALRFRRVPARLHGPEVQHGT